MTTIVHKAGSSAHAVERRCQTDTVDHFAVFDAPFVIQLDDCILGDGFAGVPGDIESPADPGEFRAPPPDSSDQS